MARNEWAASQFGWHRRIKFIPVPKTYTGLWGFFYFASQNLPSAEGKKVESVFFGGVYLEKNSAHEVQCAPDFSGVRETQ